MVALMVIAVLLFAVPAAAQDNLPFLCDSLRVESCAPLPSPTRQQMIDRLKKELADLHPIYRVPPTPSEIYRLLEADIARWRLERAKRELADLQSKYTDRYPEVIQLKSEIAALEREIAAPPKPLSPTGTPTVIPPECLWGPYWPGYDYHCPTSP